MSDDIDHCKTPINVGIEFSGSISYVVVVLAVVVIVITVLIVVVAAAGMMQVSGSGLVEENSVEVFHGYGVYLSSFLM